LRQCKRVSCFAPNPGCAEPYALLDSISTYPVTRHVTADAKSPCSQKLVTDSTRGLSYNLIQHESLPATLYCWAKLKAIQRLYSLM
jgi:hypothetical protein